MLKCESDLLMAWLCNLSENGEAINLMAIKIILLMFLLFNILYKGENYNGISLLKIPVEKSDRKGQRSIKQHNLERTMQLPVLYVV